MRGQLKIFEDLNECVTGVIKKKRLAKTTSSVSSSHGFTKISESIIAKRPEDYRKHPQQNWFVRLSDVMVTHGYDPIYLIIFLGLIAPVGISIAASFLNESVANIEGGIWGLSGWPARFGSLFMLLLNSIVGPLAWIALPLIFRRSFITCLLIWFGVPIGLWFAYSTVNLAQAVNVKLDQSRPSAVHISVAETRLLGCTTTTPLKGPRGSSRTCSTLYRIDGWPEPSSTIWIGDLSSPPKQPASICFTAHAGFLGFRWLDEIHPDCPATARQGL